MQIRHLAGPALLLTLCACGISIGFDIGKDFAIDAVVGSVTIIKPVDLSQANEVQSVKGAVEGLSINSVDLSVSELASSTGTAHLTGTLALRADGAPSDGSADLLLGDINNLAITQGETLTISGNPKADDFLLAQFKAGKSFALVLNGESDGVANFTLHAQAHLSITVL